MKNLAATAQSYKQVLFTLEAARGTGILISSAGDGPIDVLPFAHSSPEGTISSPIYPSTPLGPGQCVGNISENRESRRFIGWLKGRPAW